MVSELRFTLDPETYDRILESLQDIQAQLKEMRANFKGTIVSHESELLELQRNPETDPVKTNPVNDLEKSVDLLVDLKQYEPEDRGSETLATRQGKIIVDQVAETIADEWIALSSQPRVSEVISPIRSKNDDNISVKGYHKARKKERDISVSSGFEVFAHSAKKFMGVKVIGNVSSDGITQAVDREEARTKAVAEERMILTPVRLVKHLMSDTGKLSYDLEARKISGLFVERTEGERWAANPSLKDYETRYLSSELWQRKSSSYGNEIVAGQALQGVMMLMDVNRVHKINLYGGNRVWKPGDEVIEKDKWKWFRTDSHEYKEHVMWFRDMGWTFHFTRKLEHVALYFVDIGGYEGSEMLEITAAYARDFGIVAKESVEPKVSVKEELMVSKCFTVGSVDTGGGSRPATESQIAREESKNATGCVTYGLFQSPRPPELLQIEHSKRASWIKVDDKELQIIIQP